MKLTQDTLPNYFSIADSNSSWLKVPTNTFNFISNHSRTLVVTVGDSWTWGADMSANNSDKNLRLNCLYGRLIANELGSDWLNLGLSATGNFWLASMVEEFAKTLPELEYDKIYVICTFTETGRWFNTQYDLYINYLSWFRNNISKKEDFDKLLHMLNNECISRILAALKKYTNVDIKVGTNFVDQIGFDQLSTSQRLVKPWIQTMGYDYTDPVYVCVHGVDALVKAQEFIDPENHSLFKEWMIGIMDLANERIKILNDKRNFMGCHPGPAGHQQWANYILGQM